MDTRRTVRRLAIISFAALLSAPLALAGSISLEWDAVPLADGYRVYWGLAQGSYDYSMDVGNVTSVDIEGIDGCTRWYAAVKAYNAAGESPIFSNEIAGSTRPEISAIGPAAATQGAQMVFEIEGSSFKPGMELSLDPATVPTDVNGQPLIRVENYSRVGCGRIEVLLSVEPLAAGQRAMPIGDNVLQFSVTNPDGVWGSNPVHLDVELDPARLDVNSSNAATRDRIDGQDLVWLTYAYGSQEGDPAFNADADLDGSGTIDGTDLSMLSSVFGSCWDGEAWSVAACS